VRPAPEASTLYSASVQLNCAVYLLSFRMEQPAQGKRGIAMLGIPSEPAAPRRYKDSLYGQYMNIVARSLRMVPQTLVFPLRPCWG